MKISEEEFLRLALAQMDAVDRMARSLTRNRTEADDLVQETFLRAFKARETFDLKAFGIGPWMLRILHNLYISRVRREQKQPKAVEAYELEDAAGGSSDPIPSLELTDDRLEAALEQLTPDLRSILILWAVDELSYKEIAAVLEVPIGTVMSRLHRARRRLGQLLADHPAAHRSGSE